MEAEKISTRHPPSVLSANRNMVALAMIFPFRDIVSINSNFPGNCPGQSHIENACISYNRDCDGVDTKSSGPSLCAI